MNTIIDKMKVVFNELELIETVKGVFLKNICDEKLYVSSYWHECYCEDIAVLKPDETVQITDGRYIRALINNYIML